MKLDEIFIGPTQELGLVDDWEKNLKPTGKKPEGFDLLQTEIGNQIIFVLADEKEQLAILVTKKVKKLPGKDKNVLLVERSYVEPKNRGKGYAPTLYSAVPRLLGFILMSDQQLSPEALKLWKKLETYKVNTVSFYKATKDGGFVDIRPEKDSNVRFILENDGDTDYQSSGSIILEDMKFFTA